MHLVSSKSMLNLKLLLKVSLTVLLSFTQLVGMSGVARSQPVVQPGSQAIPEFGLRYDGIYLFKIDSGAHYYLRFYPDGTVIWAVDSGNPATAAVWFNQDSKQSRGSYTITPNVPEAQIQFTIRVTGGPQNGTTIDEYQGTIQKAKLVLQVESLSGKQTQRTYEFVPVQFPELVSNQQLVESQAGLIFKSRLDAAPGVLNVGNLVQSVISSEETYRERGIEYVNRCPKGKKSVGYYRITDYGTDLVSKQEISVPVGRSETQAWFVSRTMPPAPGLRVVVRNASQAGSGKIPYTDRDYSQAPQSEDFIAAIGEKHYQRYLSMNRGITDLTYEIKRGEQVMESGKFTVKLTEQQTYFTRTVTIPRPQQELDCVDEK
jgi:hypothetical protein